MRSDTIIKIAVGCFLALFFTYLFGPLIIMSMSAFNSYSFPTITPWDCFTTEWFSELAKDQKIITGIKNSLVVGLGVVLISVPIGLAGSLMLTQVSDRYRPWYYTIIISPILVPGVVIGISTLVFWQQLLPDGSNLYNGIFLTILGQSTFVSAYCMLIFISRLQRFDPVQEEASLDLGATHVQTFYKVLLPFLKPAIASAAVLAFLTSFENYNTTIFTILSDSTLTTVLAGKVRLGIKPTISALAVIIIVITLICAVYFEIAKRREDKAGITAAKNNTQSRASRAGYFANPAVWLATAVFIAGFLAIYFAGTIGVNECKQEILETKKLETQLKIEAMRARQLFRGAERQLFQEEVDVVPSEESESQTDQDEDPYQSLFSPQAIE